jgi:hypothetical protein
MIPKQSAFPNFARAMASAFFITLCLASHTRSHVFGDSVGVGRGYSCCWSLVSFPINVGMVLMGVYHSVFLNAYGKVLLNEFIFFVSVRVAMLVS